MVSSVNITCPITLFYLPDYIFHIFVILFRCFLFCSLSQDEILPELLDLAITVPSEDSDLKTQFKYAF